MKFRILKISFFLFISFSLGGQSWRTIPHNPVELGHVNWEKDYDQAIAKAIKSNKAIFILFQEVPGCSTCQNYGKNVLSHPLIVEAIETHFQPLVVYNNLKRNAQILTKFNEPSWNNPVVRIINPKTEKDITNRLNGVYDIAGLISTIQNALLQTGKTIPQYLNDLLITHSATETEVIYFSMYCFWSGEIEIGKLQGILSTEAGFMHGKEVVKVVYDKNAIATKQLISKVSASPGIYDVYADNQSILKEAKELNINIESTSKYKIDKEDKYYLQKNNMKCFPLTAYQKMKVNAALGSNVDFLSFLSPRQLSMLKATHKNETCSITDPISDKWYTN